MTDTPHPAESDLCLACGMCCDNTMFGRVVVEAEEAERLRPLGIDIIEYDDGELSYNQPCSRLCDKTCGIYADRPWTCESYVCETIKALRSGKLDQAEAQERIDTVLDAKATLAAQAGDVDLFEYRNRVTDALAEGTNPADLPHLTPELSRLEELLNRWFRTEEYRKVSGLER
jgi:Fe-S-cluster containining protein